MDSAPRQRGTRTSPCSASNARPLTVAAAGGRSCRVRPLRCFLAGRAIASLVHSLLRWPRPRPTLVVGSKGCHNNNNDPSGIAQALEDIEALKKELRDQRAEFETQIKLLKACQENIVTVLKDTVSKAELEQVREAVIVASETGSEQHRRGHPSSGVPSGLEALGAPSVASARAPPRACGVNPGQGPRDRRAGAPGRGT